MALTYRERKAALVLEGVSISEIGRQLGVSQQHVSQVLSGRRRSPRVEDAIATAIGKPIEEVFPPAESAGHVVAA